MPDATEWPQKRMMNFCSETSEGGVEFVWHMKKGQMLRRVEVYKLNLTMMFLSNLPEKPSKSTHNLTNTSLDTAQGMASYIGNKGVHGKNYGEILKEWNDDIYIYICI